MKPSSTHALKVALAMRVRRMLIADLKNAMSDTP
jgi:hypothetical protein